MLQKCAEVVASAGSWQLPSVELVLQSGAASIGFPQGDDPGGADRREVGGSREPMRAFDQHGSALVARPIAPFEGSLTETLKDRHGIARVKYPSCGRDLLPYLVVATAVFSSLPGRFDVILVQ